MDRREIRILPPAVSRRIAAGEVIERPASAVRELVENSVDAGSASVSVQIEGGGVELIRVTDDGSGMTREDLELLARPHATSKIREESDLLGVSTLGFRGEAMASLASVAELEVLSSTDGLSAWRHSSRPGRPPAIEPSSGRKGTIVEVRRLFETFPARKRFLKQARTETLLSVQTFVERALPHPGISFRLSVDGKQRLFLPPSSLKARVLSAKEVEEPESFFLTAKGGSGSLSIDLVLGSTEIHRPDRRDMLVFVNGRRVQDFGLVKALEIGYSGWLPGGLYPFAFAFLSIDPSLVDFNIHPAKKEIRFRDPSGVQAALIDSLRSALSSLPRLSTSFPGMLSSPSVGGALFPSMDQHPQGAGFSAYFDIPSRRISLPADALSVREAPLDLEGKAGEVPSTGKGRVLGQALGTFILVEWGESVYFVDQHAAHERLIFNRLCERPPARQSSLIPLSFETEGEDEDDFLRSSMEGLVEAGYAFRHQGGHSWNLEGWPAELGSAGLDVVKEILSLRGRSDLLRALRAMTACKAAVKDGDELDGSAMEEIASFALGTAEPRCPHGRPLYWRVDREELFRSVGRIVK